MCKSALVLKWKKRKILLPFVLGNNIFWIMFSDFCEIPELITHLQNNYKSWKELEEEQNVKDKDEEKTWSGESKVWIIGYTEFHLVAMTTALKQKLILLEEKNKHHLCYMHIRLDFSVWISVSGSHCSWRTPRAFHWLFLQHWNQRCLVWKP